MEPKSEKKVKRWMEKQPCSVEETVPSWLLTCKCISCRKERARIGIARKEDEPMEKSLTEEHRRNIRIAMKKSWARRARK